MESGESGFSPSFFPLSVHILYSFSRPVFSDRVGCSLRLLTSGTQHTWVRAIANANGASIPVGPLWSPGTFVCHHAWKHLRPKTQVGWPNALIRHPNPNP